MKFYMHVKGKITKRWVDITSWMLRIQKLKPIKCTEDSVDIPVRAVALGRI